MIEHGGVQGDVGGFLDVDAAAGGLQVDHVGAGGRGEAQDGEAAFQARVLAGPVGQDLHGDRRGCGGVGEPLELGAHHGRAAGLAAQHGLVEHGPELEGGLAGQQFLAGGAGGEEPVGLGGVQGGHAGGRRDRAGVAGGLQQRRDELGLVGADGGSVGFQADVGGVRVGQHVAVAVPPAALAGLAGQRGQGVAPGGVADLVQVEQGAQVGQAEPDELGALDPAELGPVPAQLAGGLLVSEPGCLAELPQLGRQPAAADRRAAQGGVHQRDPFTAPLDP